MLNIDWRSAADYRDTRSIPAAGFAWEYLRRDEDYRREFLAIDRAHRPRDDELDAFARRWGVRFPERSRNPVR